MEVLKMQCDLCFRYEKTEEGRMKVIRFNSIVKCRDYFESMEKEGIEYAYIRVFDGWRYRIKERLIKKEKNNE